MRDGVKRGEDIRDDTAEGLFAEGIDGEGRCCTLLQVGVVLLGDTDDSLDGCDLLDDDDALTIVYTATTDAPTPCNFTNHAYFNLNGGDGDDGLAQVLQIHADRYQPVSTDGIPDAAPRAVEGTGFDFRQPKRLDADFLRDLDQQKVKGYDHSFLLGEAPSDASTGAALQLAAELRSADGRVSLQVHTNQPALHLYTGQYLGGTEKRDGSHYADLAGVALESQFPPDSPSHGRAILLPGQTYRRTTRFDFRF